MRRISPLSFLKFFAVTLALVVAVDYASFAATGQSLVLGKLNKANRVTTVERTASGPALSLVTKPGSAPLKVNRTTKVANLNADRLDGLDSTRLARRPRVSAVPTTACTSLPAVTTSFQKITDLASFTKEADDTLVRLDLANRVNVDGMTGTGTIFELRVDDAATTLGSATMLVRAVDGSATIQRPFFGVFEGLSAGQHTVSVWARVNSGTGSGARIDPGCWNSANVNQLLVTEF